MRRSLAHAVQAGGSPTPCYAAVHERCIARRPTKQVSLNALPHAPARLLPRLASRRCKGVPEIVDGEPLTAVPYSLCPAWFAPFTCRINQCAEPSMPDIAIYRIVATPLPACMTTLPSIYTIAATPLQRLTTLQSLSSTTVRGVAGSQDRPSLCRPLAALAIAAVRRCVTRMLKLTCHAQPTDLLPAWHLSTGTLAVENGMVRGCRAGHRAV